MLDILLAFIALLGTCGLVIAAEKSKRRSFAWLVLATGLGILANGPVILLQVRQVHDDAGPAHEQSTGADDYSVHRGTVAAVIFDRHSAVIEAFDLRHVLTGSIPVLAAQRKRDVA